MPRSNGRRRFALVTVEVFFFASQEHEHLSSGSWWRPRAPGGLPAYRPVGPFKTPRKQSRTPWTSQKEQSDDGSGNTGWRCQLPSTARCGGGDLLSLGNRLAL